MEVNDYKAAAVVAPPPENLEAELQQGARNLYKEYGGGILEKVEKDLEEAEQGGIEEDEDD